MKVIDIQNFEHLNEISSQYQNIILSISAPWCKPCKEIKPKIEKFLSVIDKENFVYCKVDYDNVYTQESEFEKVFNVSKIPYFCFLHDKKSEYIAVTGDFENLSKNLFQLIQKFDHHTTTDF